MNPIHVHLHFHPAPADVPTPLFNELKRIITMNQQETLAVLTEVESGLTAVSDQIEKATNEVILAISQGGQNTPEVDAKLNALKGRVAALKSLSQTLDDLHVDAPAPAPAEGGSTT